VGPSPYLYLVRVLPHGPVAVVCGAAGLAEQPGVVSWGAIRLLGGGFGGIGGWGEVSGVRGGLRRPPTGK
jgi:hypothetical protein